MHHHVKVALLILSSFSSALSLSPSSSLTHAEISRYSRHLVLPDVGLSGQMALKNARVLVIGAGGLGSPCLLYLAAAGIGHIGIVDGDTVDESNLQRQIIHGTSTLDVLKCHSAERRIKDINPLVHVQTFAEELTSQNAKRILENAHGQPWTVVVDGSDNFPTKYLIGDACELLALPWVYSAILGFEGQVSTFNYKGGPNYRDFLPHPPPPGEVPSCAEGGVLGVLPGIMGCLQATEVIKIVLGKERGLLNGRVMVVDAMNMKFNEIGVTRLSGRENVTTFIGYQGFCSGPKNTQIPKKDGMENGAEPGRTLDESLVEDMDESIEYNAITPVDCLNKMAKGWVPWVLDVRLKSENDIVQLPFTDLVVPHRQVRLDHIPKDGEILLYCKGGVRGKKACVRLIKLGVDPHRLYNLEGGILRWQKDIDPSMPRY